MLVVTRVSQQNSFGLMPVAMISTEAERILQKHWFPQRSFRETLLFTFLVLTAQVGAQSPGPCEKALPPAVQSYVEHQFPEWRAKALADLEGYDRQLWRETHKKECPGIAVGYFENSEQLSYALLLVPRSTAKSGYKFVVITSAPENTYHSEILDHNDSQGASGMVISKSPPGKYSDSEQTKTVQLKLDSISLDWLEKSSMLYYWSDGHFLTIDTSD